MAMAGLSSVGAVLTSQSYGHFSGVPRDAWSARRQLEEYKHTEKVGTANGVAESLNIAASSVVAPYDTKLTDEVESTLPKLPVVVQYTPRKNIHLGRKNATSDENGLLHPLPETPRQMSARRSPRRAHRGDIGNFTSANPHAKVLEPYNPNAARNRLPIGESSAGPSTRFGRRPNEHPNPITVNSPRVPQAYTTTNQATYKKPGKKSKRKGMTTTTTNFAPTESYDEE